jgi:hypothetical protein
MKFSHARTLLISLLAIVLVCFPGCSIQDPDQPAVGSVSGGDKKLIENTPKGGRAAKSSAAKH